MDSYNLETLSNKNRDFSNPMYDAVQSDSHMGKSDIEINYSKMTKNNFSARIYDVPADAKESSSIVEPSSAVIAPSSIVHRTSPQLQIKRPRELDPTTRDTGKDTQALVEEDKSEC
jgi:low density lipoprotein-related protein 2